jgi:hypothetical protein
MIQGLRPEGTRYIAMRRFARKRNVHASGEKTKSCGHRVARRKRIAADVAFRALLLRAAPVL